MISDTILDYMTHLVGGMNGGVFIIGQLIVFIFLGLVVPSSSGLAVLAMPIMAPLADTVGIPRDIVVIGLQLGTIYYVIPCANRIGPCHATNAWYSIQ